MLELLVEPQFRADRPSRLFADPERLIVLAGVIGKELLLVIDAQVHAIDKVRHSLGKARYGLADEESLVRISARAGRSSRVNRRTPPATKIRPSRSARRTGRESEYSWVWRTTSLASGLTTE